MIELSLGFMAKINPDSIHIQNDYLKVCVSIYPPAGSKSFDYFQGAPCLNHFIKINPDTTKAEMENIIRGIFDSAVLRQLDDIQGDRQHKKEADELLNEWMRMGKILIAGDKEKEKAADTIRLRKISGLINFSRCGDGKILEMNSKARNNLIEKIKARFTEASS